ncbi:MAG: hypothetical protein IKZ87_00810 [Actinomycetaceae bacterium]|nr:hypothetical protein [Actinomycetaceae bacterium]
MDIKQKWQEADIPVRIMYVGGVLMALLMLVLLVSFMMPKRKPVQQFAHVKEDPLPAVYARLEKLEEGLNTLNAKIEKAYTSIKSDMQRTDATYEDAFGTLAEELENHRVALENFGRLQAVPKSILVIHKNKGEERKSGSEVVTK